MSALGQKQTLQHVRAMSALTPKADIGTGPRIRFGATAPVTWDIRRDLPPAAAALKLRFTRTMSPRALLSGTEITQVIALSACVSAFVSLFLLAAFR